MIGFSVVLLGSCTSCTLRVREPSAERSSEIREEVLELTQQIQAAAERADPEGLFLYHSGSPETMHIHNGVRYSKDELIANYRSIYQNVEKQEINFGTPVVSVLSENLVLVASQGTFQTTMVSGATLSGEVAWTYLWQRQGEAWMLLHAHQSFPGPIGRSGR